MNISQRIAIQAASLALEISKGIRMGIPPARMEAVVMASVSPQGEWIRDIYKLTVESIKNEFQEQGLPRGT